MPNSATADDVLVFRRAPDSYQLIGGRGRGAGWAGIVEVAESDSEALSRAWRSGGTVRVSSETKVNVCGPYWAAHAVVVPVGHEHIVVFGGASVATSPDAAFVRAAAQAVADTGDASAEKLLSDELEVVQAMRELMAFQPLSVRDTARHVATVAARALSCDVAAVRVRTSPVATLEVLQVADGEHRAAAGNEHAGRDAEPFLDAVCSSGNAIVEQTVGPHPEVWKDRVVSRMTLPIGRQSGLGAISLGHAEGHERGFTSLCQRIGRAIAESAEPLLKQAIAHEQLTTEHEEYRRATRTDPLTGVGNRAAWEATKTAPPPLLMHPTRRNVARTYAVLSADVDDLKLVNDRYGHSAGDAALRAAAHMLRSSLRPDDLVFRVGGDEFLALMPYVGEREARRVVRRLAEAMGVWPPTDHGVTPRLSIGWAIFDGDWEATVRLADRRMYADKRRRDASERRALPAPEIKRRARRRSESIASA